MDIQISQEQGRVGVTVFRLQGELITEDELVSKARQAYQAGARNILIDLSNVTYVSSIGLRALHELFTMLRTDDPTESNEAMKRGINAGVFTSPHLKLLNPSKHVLEVLKITGYDMFIDIHHNYQKAIASF
ncbi:MAG: STAS domain-containing protein [Acidobacteriaceae bacterium]